LEGDSELEEPEALAAVSLRDREPLQPQLGRHLLPDGAVEARLGLGETPHLPDRPALLDEAPHHRPELLLLTTEREVQLLILAARLRLATRETDPRRSPAARYAGNRSSPLACGSLRGKPILAARLRLATRETDPRGSPAARCAVHESLRFGRPQGGRRPRRARPETCCQARS